MVAQLPTTILILLPGYLAVRVFFWRSHWRHQSDLELLLWSLGVAFLMLVPISGAWHQWLDGPSFVDLLSTGDEVPWEMAVALYAAAPPAGSLFGWLDRSGHLATVLSLLGIDLERREDVWFKVFSTPRYCRIRTVDGRTYYGWPQHFSRDRRGDATELYLVNVQRLEEDEHGEEKWAPLDETIDGIWLDASNIAGIAVTTHGYPDAGRQTGRLRDLTDRLLRRA